MSLPRVGHISFINCAPHLYGYSAIGLADHAQIVPGVPTSLNNKIVGGDLDISPMSVIEYLRHADDLLLLPDLGISADGPVMSIALESAVDAHELHGADVELTATSATSCVLVDILLRDYFGVRAHLRRSTGGDGHGPRRTGETASPSARLLIGDPALRTLWQPKAGMHTYDLGELWTDLTGQAMVFAVWAVRRTFAEHQPIVVSRISDLIRIGRDIGLRDTTLLASQLAPREGLPVGLLERYFRTLRYGLGPRELAGLTTYAKRAAEIGALATVPTLQWHSVSGVTPLRAA